KLSRSDLAKMAETEKEIMDLSDRAFRHKTKRFEKLRNGRSVAETIKEEIKKNTEVSQKIKLDTADKYIAEEVLKTQIEELPWDRYPIVLAGGSFNASDRRALTDEEGLKMIDRLLESLDPDRFFFVIGHRLNGYERYLYDKRGRFKVFAIVPADISLYEKNRLIKAGIPVRISTELLGMGIYKSFNYEIFERRPSVVIAVEGNSAGANLIQEAKNGKGKALIYVSGKDQFLKKKAETLQGYVNILNDEKDVERMIRTIKSTVSKR
ncbi:MAG: hypothetical protein IKF68_03595, partial [Erysipelotrichaceae bacterium]|nr:hypothetical protein [Erysipelotrichaceae bacterium]